MPKTITDNELKEIAKDLVLHCFRNTILEDIHAGEGNGGIGAGFSDAVMRELMIEVVDKTYTFLTGLTKDNFKKEALEWFRMNSTSDWNEPKLFKEWIK